MPHQNDKVFKIFSIAPYLVIALNNFDSFLYWYSSPYSYRFTNRKGDSRKVEKKL